MEIQRASPITLKGENMTDNNVHIGHRQRLRERAVSDGFDSFNPHQILELLLFYSIPRQDTSETAHHLINRFGTVYGALTASEAELVKVPGVGKSTARWLRTLGELVDSYSELRSQDRVMICNLRQAIAYCESRRRGMMPDCVCQVCATPSGVVQVCTNLCEGLAWGEAQVLRAGLGEVLSVKARNVLILQYVSDEVPSVREYDLKSAEKYAYTLRSVGVELMDVILIGREGIVSMKADGYLNGEIFSDSGSRLSEYYLHETDDIPDDVGELPPVDDGL